MASSLEILQEFKDLLSAQIETIALEDVSTNSDLYRLVKLFSWAQISLGGGGGGGDGGSTSASTIADGINLSSDIESIVTALADLTTELALKANLNETQPVSVSSLPTDVANSTNQESANTKLDDLITALSDLLTELELKADLTETQPVSLLSTTEDKLDSIVSELESKANLTDTQPVSLDSIPLATDAATLTLQEDLYESLGNVADTAATSNTGSFSLVSFIKRLISHLLAPRTTFGTSISTSGDNTIISAPSSGQEIVIPTLRIQSNVATATSCLIKKGAGDTNPIRVRTNGDASGFSEVYGFSDAIRCGSGNAFIINLSGANDHSVSVSYYLASTTTGLPI